jgi:hypothetical protein
MSVDPAAAARIARWRAQPLDTARDVSDVEPEAGMSTKATHSS